MNKIFKLLNSFLLEVQTNRVRTFLIIVSWSWLVSVYAFISLDGFQTWDLINGLTLSFTDMPHANDGWILTGKLLWMLTLASAIVFVALKDWLYEKTIHWITSLNINENHIIVISDDFERILKSIDKDKNLAGHYKILIVNHVIDAELKEHYRKRKVFFVSTDEMENITTTNCEFIIIANNAEFENLETAKKLDEENKKNHKNNIKIYTRINNYNTMTSSIGKDDEEDTNIMFFNIGMHAARQLFQKTPLTTFFSPCTCIRRSITSNLRTS